MPLEIEDVWLDWQEDLLGLPQQGVAVSGGLGAGKTNVIPKIMLDQALNFPKSRGAIAMPTYEQLDDSLHFEIESYFAKLRVQAHFNKKEKRWYFPNGSTAEYVSFNVTMEALKGPEYDYGIIDEGDNKIITRDKFEAFEGRIGRSINSPGSGKLWVFLNPVSHGHHVYQYFREYGDPNTTLVEISTYHNRRFLRPGYIEKRERRYPPGTPGHDRWVMGKCGIPSERAVYKHFKYDRDHITLADLIEKGGLRHFRSGIHLADGQPAGWMQVGFMRDGTMVPVREVLFSGDAPDAIAKAISKIRDPRRMLDLERLHGVIDPTLEILSLREAGPVLADRKHKAFTMLSAGGLQLSVASSNFSTGINKARNRIQKGELKLLKLDDGRCATPEFLVELEEHQFSEQGKLEEEKWSMIRPFEFLSVFSASGVEQNERAAKGLQTALTATPGAFNKIDRSRRAF